METRDRNRALGALRSRNIVKVVVHFSGGNDEGGADEITGTTADGQTVNLKGSNAHRGSKFNSVTRQWEDTGWVVYDQTGERPATPDEIASSDLSDILESPVYDEYGSFAGEFYVSGTVTWDVATGRVKMERNEEMSHYEYSERDF